MSRLYELTGAYREIAERADAGEDLSEQLSALAGRIEDKAAAIVRIERDLQLDSDKLGEEIKRLTARKRAVDASRDRLREYLRTNMDVSGISKVKAATFTISLSDGNDRVEVVDESLVPDTYVRITRTVNKAAVLDAFKQTGEIVPGCSIERGTKLTIK